MTDGQKVFFLVQPMRQSLSIAQILCSWCCFTRGVKNPVVLHPLFVLPIIFILLNPSQPNRKCTQIHQPVAPQIGLLNNLNLAGIIFLPFCSGPPYSLTQRPRHRFIFPSLVLGSSHYRSGTVLNTQGRNMNVGPCVPGAQFCGWVGGWSQGVQFEEERGRDKLVRRNKQMGQ